MDEKLYYCDSTLLEFRGRVVAERSLPDAWACRLDRTAFYPQGGGQPADRGQLAGEPVDDVRLENGQVWHYFKRPLAKVGAELDGQVDAAWRYEYQQQHSGQHLLSALLFQRGAATVSVRLGRELVSIEIEGAFLDAKQLLALEGQANLLICERHPIRDFFPSDEELAQLSLRRDAKVSDGIRVVEIDGIDCTPCGGVHCQHLGQVGLVRFRSQEKIRGHQRLHWLVGDRAHADHRRLIETADRAGALLSVPADQVVERCQRLLDEQRHLQQGLQQLQRNVAQLWAQSLAGQSLVLAHEPAASQGQWRQELAACLQVQAEEPPVWPATLAVCTELAQFCASEGRACVVIWQHQGEIRWFCSAADKRIGEAAVALLRTWGGKGGGKVPLWQGRLSVPLTAEQLDRLRTTIEVRVQVDGR